jgi:glucokinase
LLIVDLLAEAFPLLEIKCERSANCSALGEYWYGNYQTNNFLSISLDTCMESAAIINKELFYGAHGNGVQLANILINGEQSIEKELRWNYLEEYIYKQLDQEANTRSLLAGKSLSAELVYQKALLEDRIARSVFIHAGGLLGKALISALTILDVTTILLTGNLAIAINLMLPSIKEQLHIHLAEYYIQRLIIKKAVVGEKAALLGAACLFM